MKTQQVPGGVVTRLEGAETPQLPPVDPPDPDVVALIDSVRALKAAVKQAPSGPITLTKAQTLDLVRAVLWILKGDKTS